MKKKTRDIVVDGVDYKWLVTSTYMNHVLKIWRADSKVPIFEEAVEKLGPWANFVGHELVGKKGATPGLVACLIKIS